MATATGATTQSNPPSFAMIYLSFEGDKVVANIPWLAATSFQSLPLITLPLFLNVIPPYFLLWLDLGATEII